MGQLFGKLTRADRLPLLAVAIALYRARGMVRKESPTILSMLGSIFVGKSLSARIMGDVIGVYVAVHLIKKLIKFQREVKHATLRSIKDVVGSSVLDTLEKLPVAKEKIGEEFAKMESDLEKSLKDPNRDQMFELPKTGKSHDEILTLMKGMYQTEKGKWQEGWVSGAVYHGGEDHMNLQNEAFKLFSISNPLHPDIWPSVMKFEAEIVSMTANMLNGGLKTVCGTMSSGGTESICLAARAHKEFYRKYHGITEPEIVAPMTAHAGIDKACELMGIKLIHVPVDPVTFKVNPSTVKAALTENTIMIYSSAPNYPSGIVDPLDELSKIAKSHGCGMHIDMCLGGFILPFAKKLGYFDEIGGLNFEFGNLPGATSISCDSHKYGYSAKGTSIVLYRTPELRRCQYFSYPSWPGGLYVTPSIAGSRPGGLSAACWASMVAMGEQGYLDATKKIIDSQRKIKAAAKSIDGLEICGDPIAMIVAFKAEKFNIYSLGDKMHKRGWSLNSLQRPASIHICVTMPVVNSTDRFIQDLRECVAECMSDPNPEKGGDVTVYGMASAMPAGPVNRMLAAYTDVVLKV